MINPPLAPHKWPGVFNSAADIPNGLIFHNAVSVIHFKVKSVERKHTVWNVIRLETSLLLNVTQHHQEVSAG